MHSMSACLTSTSKAQVPVYTASIDYHSSFTSFRGVCVYARSTYEYPSRPCIHGMRRLNGRRVSPARTGLYGNHGMVHTNDTMPYIYPQHAHSGVRQVYYLL